MGVEYENRSRIRSAGTGIKNIGFGLLRAGCSCKVKNFSISYIKRTELHPFSVGYTYTQIEGARPVGVWSGPGGVTPLPGLKMRKRKSACLLRTRKE